MDHGTHDMPMPAPGHPQHGGHGGGGMDDGGAMQCSMSMVWNTATEGVCVVFPSWRVSGPLSLFFTLAALFLLAATLEYLRHRIRQLDAHMITSHRLASGLFAGLSGITGRDGHRRKASIQQVLGHGHSHVPGKSSSIGGPTLATSANGLGLGDRRTSPSHSPPDTGSLASHSEDDLPLLPGGGQTRSRKRAPFPRRLYDALVPSLPISRQGQLRRAALYVVTLTLSMFLMLVFMTYNAWLIAAVLLGAGTGHYLFNRDLGLGVLSEDKAVCH